MSTDRQSENSIRNKGAIVTGGTRGIGYAIAKALLEEGANVAICGVSQKNLDTALESLSAFGQVFGVLADVSKYEQVKHFINAAQLRLQSIGVLINNAGAGVFRPTLELNPGEWDRVVGVNLSGAYYCSHEILPIFKRNGGGDIVNISSLAGRNPLAGGSAYNASKFGLNGFSEAMMLDHRNDGVRVSYVMPGSVATEFGSPQGTNPNSPDSEDSWKIAPDDVADVVLSLLRMPRRTTVSRVEMRPSVPAKKTS